MAFGSTRMASAVFFAGLTLTNAQLGSGSFGAPPQATPGAGGGLAGALNPTGLGANGLGMGLGGAGPAAPATAGAAVPPPQLPTLNLLGGAGGLGAAPLGGGGGLAPQTPQNIMQQQAEILRDPKIDSLCPGVQRRSVNVGAECWKLIWTNGGCKAENVPEYEQWHQAQSLEVLVADVVQWAHLPDERHKQGCYGDSGPPVNEPAPPMAQGGMGMGMGMGAGMGSGMGSGMGLGMAGLGAGQGLQQQGPPPPPEVVQKVESALQSPELANLCPGVSRQTTGVGEACWKKIWVHAGCVEESAPPYLDWHNSQSQEVLVADAAQWASLPSETHKKTCYGEKAMTEL